MGQSEPPKWADWLVEKICPDEYLEEVQGDLYEAFYWRLETKGPWYARRKFLIETLKIIRLSRFKIPDFMKNFYFLLLKNYFKTGFRFLWKTKLLSSINMLGLAIGIAAATMAYLFLSDQFAFDRFHEKSERLYRIASSMEFKGETRRMGGASYIMGKELPLQVPGIEMATHVKNGIALRKMDQDHAYQIFHYADREMFDMLDFHFKEGDPGGFKDPEGIVISESFAKSLEETRELRLLFGEEERIFTINGIFKDFPKTSSFRPNIILPFSFWVSRVAAKRTEEWFDINMNVFVLRKEGTSLEQVEKAMNKVLAANVDVSSSNTQLFLQPFAEMHTDTTLHLGNGLRATANLQVLWVVLIIGLLCLLIGCFNYSNFALGNFLSRSREVAIRKVMGANSTTIFQQFISESFLSTFIAGLLAILIIQLTLPVFSQFVGEEYQFEQLLTGRFLLGLVLILVLSTFLSGVYPSIVLASRKASLALKGTLKVGGKSFFSWFLVMLQVSLTIFLIIGTITANRQLNHLLDFDLGYQDDNILLVGIRDTSDQRVKQLKTKFKQLPFVESVSAYSNYNGTDYKDGELKIQTRHLRTDEDFVNLLDIAMISGRNFSPDIQQDQKESVLVNETFVKMAQLENPVGQIIPFSYGNFENPRIIGVVKDYHYLSPKTTVEPLIIYTAPEYQIQAMLLKMNPQTVNQNLSQVESVWREIYPAQPLRYEWLPTLNEQQMRTETQIQKLAKVGSIIAILLASLGLFGVVGTHVRQRFKEVSIRKVSGASPWDIYWLFSRKFSIWLILGFIFGALPAVYYLNGWLDNYPERIALDLEIPLMGIVFCSLVFLSIITFLLFKVINLNPAIHLKEE